MTIFVDPLKSLIDYINVVKPYHSKIYEVSVNYTYEEAIEARIFETFEIQIEDNLSENINAQFTESFTFSQDVFELNEIITVRVTDMTGSTTWNQESQSWDNLGWNDLNSQWITVTGLVLGQPPGSDQTSVSGEPWDYGTYDPLL